MSREAVCTLDFETRSAAELKKIGSWRYAADPSTEILCLAFRLPYWPSGRTGLWHPAFPVIGIPAAPVSTQDALDTLELLDWIEAGNPVEAHNAFFERSIYHNIMVRRHGWPPIDSWQWRCSAAKAAAHTLPRGLEDVAKVLKLRQQKDLEGSKLMKKLTKPRKPRKAEREAWAATHGSTPMPRLWWESKEWFERLYAYCRQDVLVESEVSATLPDLIPQELELYLIDQDINTRGFQLDIEAVRVALQLVKAETPKLNAELARLTDGTVQKATQRAKMMAWFARHGLVLPNMQKDTIEEALLPIEKAKLRIPVQRALELVQMLGKASTAKYQSMAHWMNEDGRVRGGLLFHGAGTGRWSGAGVQPHNFVRGLVKNMPAMWAALKTQDRNLIQQTAREFSKNKVRDVLAALSHALRGVIVASPGRQLYVADYAAIEARCVLWLANDEKALDIFRRHEDIYKDMAKDIYACRIEDIDSGQRQLGKQAVLGLGYQMGASKFQATCAKYGIEIDDEFAQRVVGLYRDKFWRVKKLWYDQERAAIEAVQSEDIVHCGKVAWFVEGEYLYCELPSGRRLAYPEPIIQPWETSWGGEKMALTFTGINPYSRQWVRRAAYGGLLVENITQAIARDVMAEAIRRCDTSIYDVVLSVHDELLAEADLGKGSVSEFTQLLSQAPEWAPTLPIEAEGWVDTRYRK